jgi:hypothetical protein
MVQFSSAIVGIFTEQLIIAKEMRNRYGSPITVFKDALF